VKALGEASVITAMMAAVRPGERLVMARDGHKSAFAGLVLSGARPIYVDPVYDERRQIAHGVDPASLGRVLGDHPAARAAMVFTPTRYGIGADVKALAEICHAHGIPLMTDDARGLNSSPSMCLPESGALAQALRVRAAIEELTGLDLMGAEMIPGAFTLDPTRITFDVLGLGLTGFSADDWLRQHENIRLELADHRRLMALITDADSDEKVDRLIAALRALSEAHADADRAPIPDLPHPADLRMRTVALPRDAVLGATEMVSWRDAAGRVSAEMICPYPPGSPITAPGELLTPEVIDCLQRLAAAGVMVEGAADATLAHFRVAV
jgi:arginine/lysine/ornithine decarboxylase